MDKPQAGQRWYVGFDVSARELVVACSDDGASVSVQTYGNAAAGHEQLVRHLNMTSP